MYCVYPDSTSPPRGKVVDRCHCNSRDNPCLVPNQKFTFFPNCLHCQLKSNRFVTFVYQFDSQKMIYIFSNRTDPTVLSSTRITNLQNEITWFTKSIPYKSHQFIGAFNWHTDKSDKIFVLVASNWKRKNLTLREVVDTKKFVLSTEVVPELFDKINRNYLIIAGYFLESLFWLRIKYGSNWIFIIKQAALQSICPLHWMLNMLDCGIHVSCRHT